MKTTKILKINILTLLVALLLSPAVFASHKDSEQYGPGGLSGHVAQPHGHIVSGDFTFIVSASQDVERVNFNIVSPNNINESLGRYDVSQASQASDGTKYFKLVWNSTGFKDGNYRLYANVICDKCSPPYGGQDYVVHFAGGAFLEFTVKNPEITYAPAPGDGAFDEAACQNNLPEAKVLAKTILDKNSKRLLFIDDFMQQSVLFYERSEAQIEDYNSLQGKVNESRKVASDLLVKLKVQGDFDCKSNLGAQIDSFLGTSAEFRDQSDDYKDSVINFILKVIEVV